MEEEPQAAVIADVATDPAPPASVLEEAVGRINPIYVVVPIVQDNGSSYLQVAKGGVFSYYEFPWPITDRLTDTKWRTMLDEGRAPQVPEWTDSFLVDQGEYEALTRGVNNYQNSLTSAYWYQDAENLPGAGSVIEMIKTQIRSWLVENRYLSHRLLGSNFRSFDLQPPDKAIVTASETWQDILYAYTGDYPNYDEPAEAQRGPYTLNVTYTLERVDLGYGPLWQVIQVVYAEPPPDF
jgi:hypothetical protein